MKTFYVFISCLFIGILFISSTCRKDTDNCSNDLLGQVDYRLKILNNSSKNITWEIQFNFPDTSLLNVTPPDLNANPTRLIKPGNKGSVQLLGRCWEYAFANEIPSGELQIFIFDENVIKSNSWDTIKSNYLILKRFTYTLEELKANKWEIIYQ